MPSNSLFLRLRWIPRPANHLLNHRSSHLLLWLAHSQRHVREQRRVPDIRRIAVADDVGFPFVLGCVGVAGADVAGLQGFEAILLSPTLLRGDLNPSSPYIFVSDMYVLR